MLDQRLIDFAEYLADEARKIVNSYYRKQFAIESKADNTPVTEVDQAVEKVLSKLIENNFPEHGIIGEEFGTVRGNAEYKWVIDPIDGTKSFITGRPLFGTLIALVQGEKPVIGVIDQPVLGERWLGANGETKFNNVKISTRECRNVSDAYFATTSPFLFNDGDLRKVENITKTVKCTVYGGDCYSYGQLAMGRLDLVIESGLKQYDFCALAPVIENAGGKITDWGGNEITLSSNGKVLACGNAALHEQVRDLLS